MSRYLITLRNDMDRASEAHKACDHCGIVFAKDPRNTWRYWLERARYCSQECAGLARSALAALARPPLLDKFNENFAKADGCWEWTGIKDKDGYGLFPYKRKLHRAAKLALALDGRPVPAGMYACHHCDNPACVRPEHLYPGTPSENMADAMARGRVARGERRSKLTEDDVRAIRASQETHRAMAKRYGVSRSAVSMIVERKTWRHVP